MELVSIQIDGVDWGFRLLPTRGTSHSNIGNRTANISIEGNTLLHFNNFGKNLDFSAAFVVKIERMLLQKYLIQQ